MEDELSFQERQAEQNDRIGLERGQRQAALDRQRPLTETLSETIQAGVAGRIVRWFNQEASLADARITNDILDSVQVDHDNPYARVYQNTEKFFRGVFGDVPTEEWDREAEFDALTKDIPVEYWDQILKAPTRDSAFRARDRFMEDQERAIRLSAQGQGTGIAMFAASMIDADLPLVLASGGSWGAVRTAGVALRAARAMGMSPRLGARAAGVAQGAAGGAQAGALIGAGEAWLDDTKGLHTVLGSVMEGMAMGAGLGSVLGPDVRVNVAAARRELQDNIIQGRGIMRDDLPPSIDGATPRADPEFDTPTEKLQPNPEDQPFVAGQGPSMGAARRLDFGPDDPRRGMPGRTASAHDPEFKDFAGPISSEIRDRIDWTRAELTSQGYYAERARIREEDAWWEAIANNRLTNFSTNDARRLSVSSASTLNYFGRNIFESPNGMMRGNATAAVLRDMYENKIRRNFELDTDQFEVQWARRHNKTMTGQFGISQRGYNELYREVTLEMNARAMGRRHSSDPDVIALADRFDAAGKESLGILKGRDGQRSVEGFENVDQSTGYFSYHWSGRNIAQALRSGNVDRADLVRAMADGYRRAGMVASKDAEKVAEAVIARFLRRATDEDAGYLGISTGDGREWVREALEQNNIPKHEIEGIMQRLGANVEDRGRESFAKRRNEIDFDVDIPTKDGRGMKLVDLIDNDLKGVYRRYARGVAGSAALARHGITSRAKRNEFVEAAVAEQRALGEVNSEGVPLMSSDKLHAMLSEFNAGPAWGHVNFMGSRTNQGLDAAFVMARTGTMASFLHSLGMSQLAETGIAMIGAGVDNFLRRGPGRWIDKKLRDKTSNLLEELAFMQGEIGRDHRIFTPHLNFDDAKVTELNQLAQKVQTGLNNINKIQAYTSLFNTIRAEQQKIVAASTADRLFVSLRDLKGKERNEFKDYLKRHFGFDDFHISQLEDLVNNGTIEFGVDNRVTGKGSDALVDQAPGNYVNRLNVDAWDEDLAEMFGAAMVRRQNQLIQKGMAGERDTWTRSQTGAVMSTLMSFPMLALQKQVIRNLRKDQYEAFGMAIAGLSTAYMSVYIRDLMHNRDADTEDRMRRAFMYSNMTGWFQMYWDPMTAILGLDDLRILKYGQYHSSDPAVLSWLNNIKRVPGATLKGAFPEVFGEPDWTDVQALKTIPFARAYGLGYLY